MDKKVGIYCDKDLYISNHRFIDYKELKNDFLKENTLFTKNLYSQKYIKFDDLISMDNIEILQCDKIRFNDISFEIICKKYSKSKQEFNKVKNNQLTNIKQSIPNFYSIFILTLQRDEKSIFKIIDIKTIEIDNMGESFELLNNENYYDLYRKFKIAKTKKMIYKIFNEDALINISISDLKIEIYHTLSNDDFIKVYKNLILDIFIFCNDDLNNINKKDITIRVENNILPEINKISFLYLKRF